MKRIKHLFLIAFLFPLILSAQITADGTILDQANSPIPGVSILIKGTTKGIVSDFDGNFSIELEESSSTLIISSLGYVAQEITVTNSEKLIIILIEDSQKLKEVVVIGYGSVNKKDITGSIATIKPTENSVTQSRNIESLIQGRAAGVQVSGGTEPGAPSSIRIRGLNSLTSNTEPLYVIDGIIVDSATEDTLDPLTGGSSYLAPQGGITGVNPRDIESIKILKDASATAIYGSRGANGVIIITTKKGKAGEVKFNFSTASKIGTITNNIDVLSTNQYVSYQNEIRANQGFDPSYYVYPDGSFAVFQTDEQFMIDNADTIDRLQGVNWSDDTYVSTTTGNYRLTVSGGNEKHKYYIAGGYTENTGLISNAYAKKADIVFKFNNKLSNKIKLETKVSATYAKNSSSKGTDNLGDTNSNIIRQIVSGAPILNFDDNNFGTDYEEILDGPRAWIKDYDDLSDEIRILGAIKADYKINKVFTYRLAFGSDYRFKERSIWYGLGTSRGAQKNGEAGNSILERFRYNIDNTLMFKKKFNRNHRIDGTVGATFDNSANRKVVNQGVDFDDHSMRAEGLQAGLANEVQDEVTIKERESIISFLGRLNYTLKNRYLFTATYRADGSSKFAKGNRWGHFPAFAFAWKVHKEKFLKKSKIISNAKVRLGWGLTGNQSVPNYQIFTSFGTTGAPYPDSSGNPVTTLVPLGLANPDLTWETTSQYNAGIDLGFLEDRINFTVDVYDKNISNLLLNVEIGPSTGFSRFFANQGDLNNKGIEFALSGDIINKDEFRWSVFGNISFNKNTIKNLGIPEASFGTETYSAFLGRQISGGSYFKTTANIFIEGEAPGLFYGFATNGIISNQEQLDNAPSFRGIAPQLGDILLVDYDGDNDITDVDKTIIGDPNPDFNFGFGTSIEYKRISLSAFFNGVQGNDIANGNLLREGYAANTPRNIRVEAYENAWRPDNLDGTYPRVGYELVDDTAFTDRIIEDGSYIRLSNISLGYDIPTKGFKHIDHAYLSISGQNLWLLTNYSGFDPEVNSFSFDPSRVGVDWNSFPNQKSYSMSLNITF